MNYEVIFYEDDRGRSPVKNLLDSLDSAANSNKQAKQLSAKVLMYIEILAQDGTRSGLPYTKHIGNDIWELRPKNQRILFFRWEGNKIVLLHSFLKQTKKTPPKEIEQAEREMKDWLSNGKKRLQGDN